MALVGCEKARRLEEGEMATRGNRRFDIARRRPGECGRRQDLPRRRDRVSIAGEEKQRAAQLTQIDEAAERYGTCLRRCGSRERASRRLPKIRPRKIERPPLPAQEGLDRSVVFFVCGWARELNRVDDERWTRRVPRPEIAQSPAENQSISSSDHVVDLRFGRHPRQRRRDGRLRHQVNWRTGKHETPHLSSETRSVDQREPATLAQADQIHRWSDVIHGDIEITKMTVDRAQLRLCGRGFPLDEKETGTSIGAQRFDQAVPRGQIGDSRRVRRKAQR